MQVNIELEKLSNQALCELINESVGILKGRCNVPEIKPVEEKSEGKSRRLRGPYKKRMTRKEIPFKEKRTGRKAKDFTEIDKIVRGYYGKKNYREIVEIAEERGIKIKPHEIDYRRRKLGIAKASRKNSSGPKKKVKKEQTEEEYLKTVEEQSKIDLKDLNRTQEESEISEKEYDSIESYEDEE